MRRVILRDLRDGAGTRYLSAAVNAGGLEIFGSDRGPGVARFWGEAAYEWQYRIASEHIPALVAALGGTTGDDALGLLQRLYGEQPGGRIEDFLGPGLVPAMFSSRVGD